MLRMKYLQQNDSKGNIIHEDNREQHKNNYSGVTIL